MAYPRLAFIVDVNVAWIGYALRRRGFLVYLPYHDYPADAGDAEIVDWARRLNLVIVTRDAGLRNLARRRGALVVYVPFWWDERYNSWEIVTKVVKLAALAARGNATYTFIYRRRGRRSRWRGCPTYRPTSTARR